MARKKKVINDDTEGYLGKDLSDDRTDEISFETEEIEVASPKQVEYNTIRLVNKIGARVKLPGSVTGKFYTWKAGQAVEVDERDAPDLLKKKLGDRACCGSANQNFMFEIMKE